MNTPDENTPCETFVILDSLDDVQHYLAITPSENSVMPSPHTIKEVTKEILKALQNVKPDKWVQPPGTFQGDVRRYPTKAVALIELVEQLVTDGYHQTVVRWGIYDLIETGSLNAGLQTRRWERPPQNVKRYLIRKDPVTGRSYTHIVRYSEKEYALQPVEVDTEHCIWIWPTQRMLKANKGLRKLYKEGRALKTRGRRLGSDPNEDQRIVTAWNTGGYKRYAELAREFNKTPKEIEKAIDRERHRKPRRG